MLWHYAVAGLAMVALAFAAPSGHADTIYWSTPPTDQTVYATDVATGITSTFLANTQAYGVNSAGSFAIGPDAYLYIAQDGSNGNEPPIIKVSPSGVVTTVVEQPYIITSMAFDSQGSLYFGLASGLNAIEKLTPGGTQTTFASGLQHPPYPVGFDPQGNLYAYTGQTSLDTVTKITPSGSASTFASNVSIYWDAAGDLYEGTASGTVTLTTPSGSTSTIASGLNSPVPLALNSAGELYVWSQGTSGEVYLVESPGQLLPVVSVPDAYLVAVGVPEPNPLLGTAAIVLFSATRRRETCPA